MLIFTRAKMFAIFFKFAMNWANKIFFFAKIFYSNYVAT